MLVGFWKLAFGNIIFIILFMALTQSHAQVVRTNTKSETAITIPNDNVVFDGKNTNRDKKTAQKFSDRDGDGVFDDEDLCPDIPGSAKAKGCPDTDGDGVPDFEDDCPTVAGLPQFKGCPDTDADGIPDNLDNCPREKGMVSNNGCPLQMDSVTTDQPIAEVKIISSRRDIFYEEENKPSTEIKGDSYYIELAKSLARETKDSSNDNITHSQPLNTLDANKLDKHTGNVKNKLDSDGDGVLDDDDKCPTISGSKSNFGCPLNGEYKIWRVSKRDIILSNDEIKQIEDIFYNLSFSYGRSVLEASSILKLNQLVDLLNKKYSWIVILHCYTNEADNAYRNQNLSTNRGNQIRKYLVDSGVSIKRVQIKGYSSSDSTANKYISPSRIEVEITR